ncbi:MAG: sodium-dependent dicarboxylate transporter 2/3/5 [Flavobacteriales bacterium]|jgi:sodium-dependent dicarboxylate transporter 2/3/5
MRNKTIKRKIILLFFPIAFILLSTLLNPSFENPKIGIMLGITLWMLGWWITEVVPIGITSLLPILLFPLTGIISGEDISKVYFNEVIFLYIGGFLLALSIEKWEVHKRIASHTLMIFGKSIFQILAGFMLISSLLSMWMSNTSIALLMLPIGVFVIEKLTEIYGEKELGKFKTGLLLGIAYASSIGGMATLIGSPTNLVFIKTYESHFKNGPTINFANWLIFAFPIYIILIIVAFLILFFFFKPKKKLEIIDNTFFQIENMKLGKVKYEQKVVLFIFFLFALLLIFRADIVIGSFRIPGWSNLFSKSYYIIDAVVAAFISILLFIIPSKNIAGSNIMDWNTANRIPWGIILLFGGGFALEKGFEVSGLTFWFASKIDLLSGNQIIIIILAACFIALLMTQLVANITVVQALLPLCVALSISLKINPLYLMLPITLSASAAFMLPISTPPNAILLATGQIKMKEMLLPGIILVIISGLVISFAMYYWGSYVFGIK